MYTFSIVCQLCFCYFLSRRKIKSLTLMSSNIIQTFQCLTGISANVGLLVLWALFLTRECTRYCYKLEMTRSTAALNSAIRHEMPCNGILSNICQKFVSSLAQKSYIFRIRLAVPNNDLLLSPKRTELIQQSSDILFLTLFWLAL